MIDRLKLYFRITLLIIGVALVAETQANKNSVKERASIKRVLNKRIAY